MNRFARAWKPGPHFLGLFLGGHIIHPESRLPELKRINHPFKYFFNFGLKTKDLGENIENKRLAGRACHCISSFLLNLPYKLDIGINREVQCQTREIYIPFVFRGLARIWRVFALDIFERVSGFELEVSS